jgi:uncharacterized integral membrane protein (TIGR00698 family)
LAPDSLWLNGFNQLRRLAPGLLACATVAMASTFISDHHGGPTLLYALLLGMAFFFLSAEERTRPGIEFASRSVLRFGVALLGARITLAEIQGLGWTPILIVVVAVALTIGVGWLVSRRMGLSRSVGVLTGGATAICGASAAMAISAVLPRRPDSERDTLFTVVAVTTLSTTAMILYPLLVRAFALSESDSGLFIGATIHDVAQVVGAGYMVSENTGDVATLTKLLRVTLLVPVVLVTSIVVSRAAPVAPGPRGWLTGLPLFLVAFVLIVLVNSAGLLSEPVLNGLALLSRGCLVVAIAALGIKTSFQELAQVGWRPVLLVVVETIFLAGLVLGFVLTGFSTG